MLRTIIISLFMTIQIFSNEINHTTQTMSQDPNYILKTILYKNKKLLFNKQNILIKYYKKNNYELFWFNENGLKPIALTLLTKIKNDPILKPNVEKVFKLQTITSLLNSLEKDNNQNLGIIKIDFILTELYDKYVNYISKGSIKWYKFKKRLSTLKEQDIIADWQRYIKKPKKVSLLLQSIQNNNLDNILNKLDFSYPNSHKLVQKLDELEKLSKDGGYIKLPKFKSLKLGSKSNAVKVLRKRLIQSEDLIDSCQENLANNDKDIIDLEELHNINQKIEDCEKTFDENLKNAVISFQKRHGLYTDGIVGKNTRKYLNTSLKNKILQIRLNLERMRWLPRNLGDEFIVINIPEYKLKMYQNKEIILDMPVIVGNKKNPTPIFSDKISYIVLNPYWRIPQRIANKEIIPKLIENPDYLKRKGINIHENWDHQSQIYDEYQIDWTQYTQDEENLVQSSYIEESYIEKPPTFRFIQIPSNTNPLGKMKFMFPNKYSVYMHDTPVKSLFNRTQRAFSHGCIRLKEPKKLLKTITKKEKKLTYNEALEILKDIEKTDLNLKRKIPVHIVYLTAWIDKNDKLNFRNDIYKYDKYQKKALY